ncbi:hypothetical protein MTO96_033865 [Rhipicephalus appendiculatus]
MKAVIENGVVHSPYPEVEPLEDATVFAFLKNRTRRHTKLFKAVCTATQEPIEDAISEDEVRVHPNSNTAQISTPSRARAEGYNNIKILKIGQEEIEVVAYAPAPEKFDEKSHLLRMLRRD